MGRRLPEIRKNNLSCLITVEEFSQGENEPCFSNRKEVQAERKFVKMAHAGRGRWHLGFAKPACGIWARVAPYHMDISIPNSPKRDATSNQLATSVTAAELLQPKARAGSLGGPSSHGVSTSAASGMEEKSPKGLQSASAGGRTGCSFLLLARAGVRGPVFGRLWASRVSRLPAVPRHTVGQAAGDAGRSSHPACPRQAVVHLAPSGPSTPSITNKAENWESLSVAERFLSP